MVYVIGAVAACLGIGVGLALGFLRWGRSSKLSLEERFELQHQQIRLREEIEAGRGTPELQSQLEVITRRLERARRQSDAEWERKTQSQRRRLRKEVGRDLQ